MALVDKVTKKNLEEFINSGSRLSVLGNADNPLKAFLQNIGIKGAGRFEDVLTDRMPLWAVDFVNNVRSAGVRNLTYARALKFIQ